ncbi:hypothetical protein A2U01_0095455, partial [Trifolium medium]|nr:hypothetical protein [Trifolium medium]
MKAQVDNSSLPP